MTIITRLSRNGMRQPQTRNWSPEIRLNARTKSRADVIASRHCIVVSLAQLASPLLRVRCKLPQRLLKVASTFQFRDYALLLDSEPLPNRGRSRTFPMIRLLLWAEGNPLYRAQRRI